VNTDDFKIMSSNTAGIDALIKSANSSLRLRSCEPGACKENVASLINDISAATRTGKGDSLWRSKALAALSQLSSLQQRASAAELKVYELQLAVDQASLSAQALEDDNSKVRGLLAESRDERDRLMLEVRLRRAKMAAAAEDEQRGRETTKGTATSVETKDRDQEEQQDEDDNHNETHRAIIGELTSRLNSLLVAHEEAKLENETLLQNQTSLTERIHALQEHVHKLQDENDYFSILKDEDVLAQEEDVVAVFGAVTDEVESNLRHQLQERESELLALHETLDEERTRSRGLHEQCIKQAEELSELRARAAATKRVERELTALKEVHADTLEKVVTLQLELGRKTDQEDQKDQKDQEAGAIPSVDEEWPAASRGASWLL
jgi:hypothetical protein